MAWKGGKVPQGDDMVVLNLSNATMYPSNVLLNWNCLTAPSHQYLHGRAPQVLTEAGVPLAQ